MLNFLKSLLFGGGNSEQIKQILAEGAMVVDVRSPQEFAQGHYKGAKNIPLDRLEANLKTLKTAGKPIVVCCASGMRSARAKAILSSKGVEQVHDAGSWVNLQ